MLRALGLIHQFDAVNAVLLVLERHPSADNFETLLRARCDRIGNILALNDVLLHLCLDDFRVEVVGILRPRHTNRALLDHVLRRLRRRRGALFHRAALIPSGSQRLAPEVDAFIQDTLRDEVFLHLFVGSLPHHAKLLRRQRLILVNSTEQLLCAPQHPLQQLVARLERNLLSAELHHLSQVPPEGHLVHGTAELLKVRSNALLRGIQGQPVNLDAIVLHRDRAVVHLFLDLILVVEVVHRKSEKR